MTVLNLQCSESADDAHERVDGGSMSINHIRGRFGQFFFTYHMGLRFPGVSGLSGSAISAATLTFRADRSDTGFFVGDWYAHSKEDPEIFTAVNFNISDIAQRPRTIATGEGDSGDFGDWTGGQDHIFPTGGESIIKDIVQELANDHNPSAIALLWIYSSGTGKRVFEAYDTSAALAAKLAVTYTAGGPPPVTGQVGFAGIGSLAAAAGLTIPASAVLSGIGTLTAAGTTGTIHEGAAVLTGEGFLTPGTPVLTLVGQASMLGEGSLVAVGERGALGTAVLSGIGSMAAVGQVGNLVEGYVSFAGVGSMSALAQKLVYGQAAMSGVASLASAGVVTVVGSAAMSGIGALSAAGETGETLFTIFGPITKEIDPNDHPVGAEFKLEVILGVGFAGTARARLYNVSDAAPVAGSDLATSVFGGTRLRSPALTLPSEPKVYRVEYGGTSGSVYVIFSAAVRVESA